MSKTTMAFGWLGCSGLMFSLQGLSNSWWGFALGLSIVLFVYSLVMLRTEVGRV